MFNSKPFSPEDAKAAKVHILPKPLLQAINELLAEKYRDKGPIHIKLKDLKARCRRILGVDEMFSGADPVDAWPNSVWDFEPVYRQHGWKVSYDSPGYNESYDGYYIFEKKNA
jgi:hypothetical protein